MVEKKARGLCLGGTGNGGIVLMGKKSSPRVLQAHPYPSLVGPHSLLFLCFELSQLLLSWVEIGDWNFNCPSVYRDRRLRLTGLMTDI